MGQTSSDTTSKPATSTTDEFGLGSTPVVNNPSLACPACSNPILPANDGKRILFKNGQSIVVKCNDCVRKFLTQPALYCDGVYDVKTGKPESYTEGIMRRSPLRYANDNNVTVLPPVTQTDA